MNYYISDLHFGHRNAIAEWNGFYKKSWHIYGHIHGAKTPTKK